MSLRSPRGVPLPSAIEADRSAPPRAIPARVFSAVLAHALEAEPEECCGLVAGTPGERYRIAVRCRNDLTLRHRLDPGNFPRDGRRGYHMNEGDYARTAVRARERGEQITAVYHSHVDCGAYFSELDQDFASRPSFPFPGADHLVIAVGGGQLLDSGLFWFDPTRGCFTGRRVVAARS